MKAIFLALFILSPVFSWKCGGARSFLRSSVKLTHKINMRSPSTSPLRIHYEYVDFDLGSPEMNKYFKETLIPSADSFFRHTMKVRSVIGNLTIHETECFDSLVPENHLKYGVPDADMVIYVTSINDFNDSYIAYAGPCELDENFRHIPIMGSVTVNIPMFIYSDFASHYSTVVHELYHVFGFNSGLFNYWKKPDGTSYASGEIYEEVSTRGARKMILKSPSVLEKAREQFACEHLKGVDLEEFGGEETAGSHWDMRIMYNDYMMGKDIEDPIYSSITLALLKDTGWFDIDYTYSTPVMFGYKEGCDFFDKPCLSAGKSNFPNLFCEVTKGKSHTCDPFHLRKAECYINEFEEIPQEFQYYRGKNWGGDPYADYCPVFKPFTDGNCRAWNSSITHTLGSADEVVGPRSRCFDSTLSRGNHLDVYAACYEVVECTNHGARVRVGSQVVLCPFTGGRFKVRGYSGNLHCPNSRILCENFPCIDGCSGHGRCLNGKCLCDEGFKGVSCYEKVSA
jgi:leishmanolysin